VTEPKLIQLQVTALFALPDEDGELGEVQTVVFNVTPSEWKKGWDWRAAFAAVFENLKSADPPPVN